MKAAVTTMAAGVIFALLWPAAAAAGQTYSTPPRVRPDVPVTASDLSVERAQNSPSLAADPTEPRFMALASRVDAPRFGCALHVSGDGGRSWQPAEPVPVLPPGAERCYAPEVGFDRSGTLYYLFVGLRGRGNTPMGAFLTTSSDFARSFTTPRRVLGARNYMVRMAIDGEAGDDGRIHLVWLHATSAPSLGGLPPPPNPILAAHSDDGGNTFSEPVQVSDAGRRRVVAPAVAVGPGGAVHVAYYDLGDDAVDYQGLEGPTWEGTWSLAVSTSLDGGRRFVRHRVVDDALVPPERVMLIFTMAPPSLVAGRSGVLYASWWDARNGDWDVFASGSRDKGRSWSQPVRLNDDGVGSGRHQSLPRLSVAPDGRVDAIFYDRRDDPENRRLHVYYTFSTDGGATFAPNLRLTSERSFAETGARYPVPSARNQVEFGSRLALMSRPGDALAAWTDTRIPRRGNTHQDIFSTSVELAAAGDGAPPPARSPSRFRWVPAVAGAGVLAAVVAGLNRRRASADRGSAA